MARSTSYTLDQTLGIVLEVPSGIRCPQQRQRQSALGVVTSVLSVDVCHLVGSEDSLQFVLKRCFSTANASPEHTLPHALNNSAYRKFPQ